MEKLISDIKKLSDIQKVRLLSILRDDLNLKTTTEMAHKYGRSYNGTAKFFSERLNLNIGKTTYFVDK